MANEEKEAPRYIFQEGGHALLIDRRGRKHLLTLDSSRLFESHTGALPHSDILGKPEGLWVTTNKGHNLLAVKPTMADFALEMPRIATVGYPKDMGPVLVYGDFFPGARVLEAGCGSGAMTMTLLRAVGPQGMMYSYDIRQDMIDRARANVAAVVVDHSNLCFKLGDVYQGFEETDLDRIFLDLPEPWQVVPHAAKSLVPGGIFVSFLPTILQVHELVRDLRAQRTFEIIETMEVLMRNWVVRGRSVRPDHRMIGHTGFITTARKCDPRPVRPEDEDSDDGGSGVR